MKRNGEIVTEGIDGVTLRRAVADDLEAINRVVERAVMSWRLPERVKRLSLPSYRYHGYDLTAMEVVVAEAAGEVVGVAAWEPAPPPDLPPGRSGLLLHGLYVEPGRWRGGVGGRLLDAALRAAGEGGLDGLLVKAQVDAAPFFAARGMERLPVVDPARDYPHRFWRAA